MEMRHNKAVILSIGLPSQKRSNTGPDRISRKGLSAATAGSIKFRAWSRSDALVWRLRKRNIIRVLSPKGVSLYTAVVLLVGSPADQLTVGKCIFPCRCSGLGFITRFLCITSSVSFFFFFENSSRLPGSLYPLIV